MSFEDELRDINKEYQDEGTASSLTFLKGKGASFRDRIFKGRVIRILNEVCSAVKYIGLREKSEIELIIDTKLADFENRYKDELKNLDNKISNLKNENSLILEKINVLDSVSKGVEKILTLKTNQAKSDNLEQESFSSVDFNYVLLENRFRGSEDEIKRKTKPYVAILKELLQDCNSKVVLEIGAGRGEFLENLRDEGIPGKALEIDSGMISILSDKGFQVETSDANTFLKNTQTPFGAIVAFQVVEHLKYPYLKEFLELCYSALDSSGILLLETINTSSLLPLMQNYFRDPTHTAPLHPDTLSFMVEQAGFKVRKIHKTAEFPEEVKIQRLPTVKELPFRYQELTRQLNDRVDYLNKLIFDSQDYAIEAVKP